MRGGKKTTERGLKSTEFVLLLFTQWSANGESQEPCSPVSFTQEWEKRLLGHEPPPRHFGSASTWVLSESSDQHLLLLRQAL